MFKHLKFEEKSSIVCYSYNLVCRKRIHNKQGGK